MIQNPKKIVISRTDSIGDVVLTLPLAGILKEKFPEAQIVFFGNTYTKPILSCSKHVDEVWEWALAAQMEFNQQLSWLKEQNVDVFIHVFPRKELARLAKKAKIKHRIGTSHRLFHLNTCNHRPNFTRKKSDLHESQLNTKLLSPFGIKSSFSLEDLTGYLGFENIPELPEKFANLLNPNKVNFILHPKSQGSAIEWGVDRFIELAKELNSEKFEVFFTGTEKESTFFRDKIPVQSNIHDLTGQMTLDELIAFISKSDGLMAASTGPLHLAGITNRYTFGLFSSIRPIHPGRWKPLGNRVFIFEDKKNSTFSQPLAIDLREVLKKVENTIKK